MAILACIGYIDLEEKLKDRHVNLGEYLSEILAQIKGKILLVLDNLDVLNNEKSNFISLINELTLD